jgi:hypothetical protein
MRRLPDHRLALSIGLALAGCAASGQSPQQASTPTSGQSAAFGASPQWLLLSPAAFRAWIQITLEDELRIGPQMRATR